MKSKFMKSFFGAAVLATAVYSTTASALVISLFGKPILPSLLGGINLLNISTTVVGPTINNSLVGVCLGNCNTNNTTPVVQLALNNKTILSVLTNAPAVTPVPEAETIAMISLGLVVVGYQIKRRKSVATPVAA